MSGYVPTCTLEVRVTPRAGRTDVRIVDGGVRIRVAEVPENGRATEAARRALASALGLRRRDVTLRTGMTSRIKRYRIEGLSRTEALEQLTY
ncbi:MAG: DUF167 family protein [Acidimicrobiales bacterium]|jgi:hypothetical protein|nr:hypothetical protein [Acidimicrobiaceae bacterium]MDP6975747.1 DUF167 family protein [Acidimicrobiales bacterium]|tara:strand:+ start:1516 stop:1791 length:276 start_codon:yes stop_codon:yes gene_type:complete